MNKCLAIWGIAVAVLVACGGKDDKVDQSKLIGIWARTSLKGESGGRPVPVRDEETGPVVFKISDKTIKRVHYVGVNPANRCYAAQNYKIEGKKIIIEESAEASCIGYEIEISDLNDTKATVRVKLDSTSSLVMELIKITADQARTLGTSLGAREVRL